MILRLTIEENLIHRNINSSNSLIQRKMISRFQMENSRITIGLSAPFLEFIPPRDGEGRIYPRTISGAYFIFSDPWPCNLRVGEWGWVNWADASEIESTIESKSSSLRVTYALVWVSGRCPSSLLRPFHFFPFTPPQPPFAGPPGCAQEHRGPFSASYVLTPAPATFSHPNPLCWQRRVFVWLSPCTPVDFGKWQPISPLVTRLMDNNSFVET